MGDGKDLEDSYRAEEMKKIKQTCKKAIKKLSLSFEEEVTDCIKKFANNAYNSATLNQEFESLYSDIMAPILKETLNEIFTTSFNNELLDIIYEKLMLSYSSILEKMIAETTKYGKFIDDYIVSKYYLQFINESSPNIRDPKVMRYLNLYFYCTRVKGTGAHNSYVRLFEKELEKDTKDGLIDLDCVWGIEEVVSLLITIMRECYSDCCAATILDLSIQDFVLSFIYERKSIVEAFPDATSRIRLGLDLHVKYNVTRKLDKQQENAISQKLTHWKKNGCIYTPASKEIINYINASIVDYVDLKKLLEPAYEYVKECSDYMQDNKQNLFLRELCKNSNMSNNEDAYLMISKLTELWCDLKEQ